MAKSTQTQPAALNRAGDLLRRVQGQLEALRRTSVPVMHARRAHIHEMTFGERVADAVAEGMGSWRFIIAQSAIVALWMALNVIGLVNHWDPYPFILLNLLFSTQAAYAAPIIMMSQNRSATKDRKRDDLEASEVDGLFQINQQQLTILQQQSEILELLKAQQGMTIALSPAPVAPEPMVKPVRKRTRTTKLTVVE